MKELSYWLAYFAYLILIRKEIPTTYRTRAIINRGLYIFTPFFIAVLYCRVVSITDNVSTKQENSSIFGPKIRGLSLPAVSNQERVIMAHVGYILE